MTEIVQIGGELIAYKASHMGGTAVHPAGGTVTISSFPEGVCSIYMKSDGVAYYEVNGTANGTNSHGYIPAGGVDYVFPSDNLSSISFNGAAGVTIYLQYYTA
jgi:hypothetical protein